MTSINRSSSAPVVSSAAFSVATPNTVAGPNSWADRTSMARELDAFETRINSQDGRKIDDIPAKQARAMLEALIDPAAARRELARGIIGPNGDVLKPAPEPGSERYQFLKRVAAGENIPRDQVMKMAEKVRTSTQCSRIVWDMLLSSIINSIKAEKRVW